jgi:ankyrin repeat protein
MAASLMRKIFDGHDHSALKLYIKKGHSCGLRDSVAPHATLLHAAARLNCTDIERASIVELLLKKGAELNGCDDFGVNALMRCAQQGSSHTAGVLLQAGADVHAVCKQQKTALHWAASNGGAVVPLLRIRGASASVWDADGMLPLHYACQRASSIEVSTKALEAYHTL